MDDERPVNTPPPVGFHSPSAHSEQTAQRPERAASAPAPAPAPLARSVHPVWERLGAGRCWGQANTFVPSWLPTRWRHPGTVYVLAIVGQAVATLVTRFVTQAFPTFSFPTLLGLVWVALVALRWGGGPGLLATLSGAVFLEGLVEHFHPGAGWATAGDVLEFGLFLAVGSIISVLVSVTEQARRQAVREQAEAQAANRRMQQFLSMASHELRTPLTTMLLTVQQAARRLAQVPWDAEPAARAQTVAAVQFLLASHERSMRRLTRLVDDLLDASRIGADQLKLSLADGDLAAICTEAVQEQRAMHPDRSIGLNLPAAVPVVLVRGDAARIVQVVANYLSNALKYSSADRPVAIRLEVVGEQVCVAVQDQGPGLPPEEQARVWELFYRAPGIEVQSGSGIGLGLGLHICKAIIERHGGQVGVESTVGQGATFWFRLPVASRDPSRQP